MSETKSLLGTGEFDDVPFGPADYGRIQTKVHDGGVYLVTWKEALRIESEHATQLGFELIQQSGRMQDGDGDE